jgi:hypothetical protein
MEITLITSKGIYVADGPLIVNNLYKIPFQILYPNAETQYSFQTIRGAMPWEIWHRHLGHIGYNALNHMQHLNLVDGMNIELNSSKLDCIPCIQAKQSIMPFGTVNKRQTYLGELTHIDL